MQVHDEIGLSFARVLRGVLRHDPNVILVGEIRDPETAEIAVRAVQVGRLVLSTLHTNSAAGAMPRLVDLGVPDYLVCDVLRGVLGQELMLTPCPACGGRGSEPCEGTGVSGRKLRAGLLVQTRDERDGKRNHHVFKTPLWRTTMKLDTDDMLRPVSVQ